MEVMVTPAGFEPATLRLGSLLRVLNLLTVQPPCRVYVASLADDPKRTLRGACLNWSSLNSLRSRSFLNEADLPHYSGVKWSSFGGAPPC